MVDGVFFAVAGKTKIDLRIKIVYQNPYIDFSITSTCLNLLLFILLL